MTSINGLSSVSGTYRMPSSTMRQDPMAAVADKLGLSSKDLRSQLRDGKSLDDVATAQGVSHDDLISAIKAGMPADATGGVDATEMAEKIAGTKGMPPPPPGGGPRGENTGIQDSKNKGVGLTQLRDVLNSGDLLDVAA
ncbi:hypothetical protein [Actinoplanes sp. NPDC051494]|uniref:hypothetical protein n=1 Tax=Actinoplanes sp. NPDC051494 TaxID=3363907 RepID=UPI0037AC3C5F